MVLIDYWNFSAYSFLSYVLETRFFFLALLHTLAKWTSSDFPSSSHRLEFHFINHISFPVVGFCFSCIMQENKKMNKFMCKERNMYHEEVALLNNTNQRNEEFPFLVHVPKCRKTNNRMQRKNIACWNSSL